MGPSPGVQGELKELLRKLGRFSCYQGNLWKLPSTGHILDRDLYAVQQDTERYLIQVRDFYAVLLISPGPELLAQF